MTFKLFAEVLLALVLAGLVVMVYCTVCIGVVMRTCIQYWFQEMEAYESRIIEKTGTRRELSRHFN